MGKFFANHPWLVRIAAGLFIVAAFLALLFSLLWNDPWITPLPGVVLEPSRPFLKSSEIKPDSAVDFFLRASVEMKKAINLPGLKSVEEYALEEETKRLHLKPWSKEEFPDAFVLFHESAGVLDLARKAIAAGDPQVPSYEEADGFFYARNFRYIVVMMRSSAADKASRGDFYGAYADLGDTIDFADILSRGGGLSNRKYEIRSELDVFRDMRYLVLQNEVPAGVAAKTIDRLNRVDKAMEPWAETYRQQCREIPSFVKMAYFDKSNPLRLGSIFGAAPYLGPLVGSTSWQVKSDLESLYAHLIEISGKPYDSKDQKKMDDRFFGRELSIPLLFTTRDPFGYLLARSVFPNLHVMIIYHDRRIVELRATEMVLAIRQFEQVEKHPPANSGNLVPKYLPAVPLDPFDGKPLRYIVKPDGSWCVYSVGPNQVDEGGMATSTPPNGYSSPGDLVFPNSEATDALKKIKK